jgi:predicted solute-binding protein
MVFLGFPTIKVLPLVDLSSCFVDLLSTFFVFSVWLFNKDVSIKKKDICWLMFSFIF